MRASLVSERGRRRLLRARLSLRRTEARGVRRRVPRERGTKHGKRALQSVLGAGPKARRTSRGASGTGRVHGVVQKGFEVRVVSRPNDATSRPFANLFYKIRARSRFLLQLHTEIVRIPDLCLREPRAPPPRDVGSPCIRVGRKHIQRTRPANSKFPNSRYDATSKNAIARTSMERRGGASAGVRGSSNAVWNTNLGPSSFLSYTLNTRHSSLVIRL